MTYKSDHIKIKNLCLSKDTRVWEIFITYVIDKRKYLNAKDTEKFRERELEKTLRNTYYYNDK